MGEAMASFLYSRKRETAGMDFKLTIDLRRGGEFSKLVKDYFAFANSGGGYFVVGFKQLPSGRFDPVGLPEDASIDQAILQEKFNAFSPEPLSIGYREDERVISGERRRLGIVYFPPAPKPLRPLKDAILIDGDGRQRVVAKRGVVYIRRGTQSIVASASEEARAASLLKDSNYRISLISGRADQVEETLYSDLLPIVRLPDYIYRGELLELPPPGWAPNLSAFVWKGKEIFSFDSFLGSDVANLMVPGTSVSFRREEFRREANGTATFTELLKWELVGFGSSLGLRHDLRRGRFFYPLEEGRETRVVQWEGLTKESKRKVASRQYSAALHQEVCFHLAVAPSVVRIGEAEYLRMQPCFLFTTDGRTPLLGRAQGLALTSIENSVRNFNLSYLRGVLFWASQFAAGSKSIRVRTDVEISREPVQTRVPVGIQSDTVGLQRITSDESLPPGFELET